MTDLKSDKCKVCGAANCDAETLFDRTDDEFCVECGVVLEDSEMGKELCDDCRNNDVWGMEYGI